MDVAAHRAVVSTFSLSATSILNSLEDRAMSLPPDFIAELRKHFTGDIRLDRASRILYSTDASIYQIEPLGVAIPRTQDDLQAILELAAKYCVPILPRGSGSSLAGQAIGAALIVDCSRWLDNIVEVNPEARTATLEPGVILAALNKAAAKLGLQFGPDPASAERATMGGVIANNATGAHSILYGMAADHLISADVVMADGSLGKWGVVSDQLSVISDQLSMSSRQSAVVSAAFEIREKYAEAIKQNYPKTWRNSAGYRLNYLLPWSPSSPPQWDNNPGRWSVYNNYELPITNYSLNLAPLLAGSEGTLAVIRRATVNLVRKPKHTILAVLAYDSSAEACDDVPRLLSHQPSAIELISRSIVRMAQAVPAYARQAGILTGDAAALLVVEFSGDQPQALKDAALALHPTVLAESAEDQARVWNVRKMGLGILASHTGDAKTVAFIEDCAIPVERLGEFVRGVERILAGHGTQAEFYAHASGGCLHIRPILNLKTQVRALRTISEAALALTVSLGGSMSSEHGDGLAHSEWLAQTYGEEVLASFRTLKRAADPDGILNPGKILDAPPMDANLRYGADYRAAPWRPALDFTRENGLAGAIEQCNGQGVCRKFDGTMCPSFQATREESNSTRGRANLLRAMISDPYTGRQVHRYTGKQVAASEIVNRKSEIENSVFSALDLCLACKGCKAECPSGVDMAKLKFAFMHEYYKTHRRPLRDYLFGYFHITARLLSAFAPLVNWMMSLGWFKNIAARVFQITPHRPFPKFARRRAKVRHVNRPSTAGRKARPSAQGADSTVIFLSDAFSRYVEPQVEQAAFDILARCGYQVLVLPVVGAGAALISKSFLESAKRHASRVLDALNKLDPDCVLPLVGVEPPELYAVKNDYADLLSSRADEIASRAARTWLLDEYLLRSDGFSKLRVANIIQSPLLTNQPKIKFQPHCHQRAEGPAADGLPSGADATASLLRGLGFDVEVINSGCCGMAGTFGYEAEHYELSMKVGEKLLNSDFRIHSDFRFQNSEVVCSGAACRMQVTQGAGVEAKHPLEVVWEVVSNQ